MLCLSVCFWLFAPKFWQVLRTYKLSFYLKRNAASVVLAILGGGDTQTLPDGKKMNFMYSQVVGMPKLSDFP